MESHNHPSAVEPFQGAATGVGGIIRDIFTMGARPVFLAQLVALWADQLEIGTDRDRRMRHASRNRITRIAQNRRLFAGVVAGIAHYGNCIGIPTIGGEIYFDESLRRQSAGECVLPRRAAARADRARRREGNRQSGLLRRRGDRPGWPGRRGVRVARSDRGIAARIGPRCRSAIRSGKNCCSRRVSNCSRRTRSPEFRTWARRG